MVCSNVITIYTRIKDGKWDVFKQKPPKYLTELVAKYDYDLKCTYSCLRRHICWFIERDSNSIVKTALWYNNDMSEILGWTEKKTTFIIFIKTKIKKLLN